MSETGKAAAEVMRHLVEHSAHGYTQSEGRWGSGPEESIEYKGITITFRSGDRDCSAGVVSAWDAVGKVVGVNRTGYASYTGDMVEGLTSTGLWQKKPMTFLAEPGDLYLSYNRGHVAMCYTQTPDMLCEFLINENGQIIGGQVGDQTGRESVYRAYYDFPWDCIMHYVGPDYIQERLEDEVTPEDKQEIAQMSAEAVVNYLLNDVKLRDRIIGSDIAANAAAQELTRTDDPTGRGVEMKMYDHMKHMAAAVAENNQMLHSLTDR